MNEVIGFSLFMFAISFIISGNWHSNKRIKGIGFGLLAVTVIYIAPNFLEGFIEGFQDGWSGIGKELNIGL
ncbi:hypothetical protein [Bacillus kexueae]|uniref:hypothetical protein n=1 Tax=Aeribacillus kexueae TaxID=2078952 RepID=UPI001FAF20E1|nr:hypothetical protein [Bacillus kexueae]